MRQFDYITVGKILDELKEEGLPKLQRVTFYRLEKRHKFPQWDKEPNEWRRYTRSEADEIKQQIKEKYKVEEPKELGGFVAKFIDAFKK